MAHTIYENFVLANKITDSLTTAVDLSNYMTIDESLTENAGMKKIINVYTATGDVEDLDMGEGNTEEIEVGFEPVEYEVGTTQGRFRYYDEQEMTDPMVVDVGLDGLTKTMVNDFTAKAIAEYDKASFGTIPSAWGFDAVVDAIAKLNLEDESGLFLLINVKEKADFRKALGDDLKYVEGFVRTGYIGSVCGVPVIVSKAVPEGVAYLATKDAVTLFVKKGAEIEQEREANIRRNTIYARKVALVALTDATKLVKLDMRDFEEVAAATLATENYNPKTEGLYEITAGGVYALTKDETVTANKKYYTAPAE
jgi:hypothetical protein